MKPYSIQAPEDVAKEYGGNKQKIAQAAQLGIVDPTAAVLAGMFIDRMRGAQMQESVNKPTIAQQVMGGAPVPPPVSPPAAPGGLGATPQAAPPMAPHMDQGMPPQGMAAGGMVPPYAKGGIDGLPIPDTMFDENRNGGFDDGYAGGGLVAFADGAEVRKPMTDEEYRKYIWEHENRGRGDYDAKGRPLRSKAGALFGMQVLPSTAANPGYGVAPATAQTPEEYNRVGGDLALALRKQFGDVGGAMAYNWGPGNYQKWREAGSPAAQVPAETRNYIEGMGGLASLTGKPATHEADTNTAAGRQVSMDDALALGDAMLARMPHGELDRARAYALKDLDPAEQEKTRKQDMWEGLAELGFRMASSQSPNLLQAIGEAATATLPSMQASKKERKASKDAAIKMLMDVEDVDRKTATEGVKVGMEIYKSGLSQDELKQRLAVEREQIQAQKDIAAANRKSQKDIAEITSGSRVTQVLTDRIEDYRKKLRGEAERGIWKTPDGKKPSEDDIEFWARHHALEDWQKYMKGSAQASADPFTKTQQNSTTGPWTQYQQ